jgi:hypothetical protein
MNIPFRPLGRVLEIIQSTGLDISHFYDDLLISDHSVFIIQFDRNSASKLYLYFNCDCEEAEKNKISNCLKIESYSAGFDLINSGQFTLQQVANAEEITISFFKK